MSSRREQLLDAAVNVLALRGARELTHRAVDHEADLPAGSTSNVFRTRASLIDGILQHLIDHELANLPPVLAPGDDAIVDERFLLMLSSQAITHALGSGRRLTLARRALFLDATQDAAASERLARSSQFWWTTLAALLQRAGAPDPKRRARLLLAYIDGVIADQLARPEPHFDAATAIRPALRGILAD